MKVDCTQFEKFAQITRSRLKLERFRSIILPVSRVKQVESELRKLLQAEFFVLPRLRKIVMDVANL
jgi:hypothetical protein